MSSAASGMKQWTWLSSSQPWMLLFVLWIFHRTCVYQYLYPTTYINISVSPDGMWTDCRHAVGTTSNHWDSCLVSSLAGLPFSSTTLISAVRVQLSPVVSGTQLFSKGIASIFALFVKLGSQKAILLPVIPASHPTVLPGTHSRACNLKNKTKTKTHIRGRNRSVQRWASVYGRRMRGWCRLCFIFVPVDTVAYLPSAEASSGILPSLCPFYYSGWCRRKPIGLTPPAW